MRSVESLFLFVNECIKEGAWEGRVMSELILFNGNRSVLRCPLLGRSLTIGKNPTNDISLPDDHAAPFICEISREPNGDFELIDKSGHGLEVSGHRITRHRLADGEEITLGHLRAVFHASSDVQATPQNHSGRRTGVLQRDREGNLTRTQMRLRLPPSLKGALLEIPLEGCRIGAGSDNDVVLSDGFASTFHAHLYHKKTGLFIRDLDSTNGTLVNGVRVVEAEVSTGMEIQIGHETFRIEEFNEHEKIDVPSGDGPWSCHHLVTADSQFAETFQLIERVADHDVSVCVLGETGCGKELVASALHHLGGRRNKPFVPLNCAAIPSNLIESILFGHEKGAFTGADRLQKGVFEEAQGGTLFLDEVGELPLDMQAKLLRVLEMQKVRRLGGRIEIDVDVRIIAATHRDLVQHVGKGLFREDLLHRLYVIPLEIPPLRDRPADIPFLAQHFLSMLSTKGASPTFSKDALKKLGTHPFPGNIRELKNTVQRAMIFSQSATSIDSDAVQFIPTQLEDAHAQGQFYKKGMSIDDIERQVLDEALQAWGSATKAAHALGMPKTTFWRRATSLGVLKKHSDKEGVSS